MNINKMMFSILFSYIKISYFLKGNQEIVFQ